MTVAGKKSIVLGEKGAGGKITHLLIHTEEAAERRGSAGQRGLLATFKLPAWRGWDCQPEIR